MNEESQNSAAGEVIEESAGCVLIQHVDKNALTHVTQALVVRVRRHGFEIPKGHIETGETQQEAALRELREETGLLSRVDVTAPLGVLEYTFNHIDKAVRKRVYYFAAAPTEDIEFGRKPARTKELCWVASPDLNTLPLVNEGLRDIIRKALDRT